MLPKAILMQATHSTERKWAIALAAALGIVIEIQLPTPYYKSAISPREGS